MMAAPEISFLEESLAELEALLAERAPHVYEALRPGMTDRAIDELTAPLSPYRLPDDLRALYRWHCGHDAWKGGRHRPLFPGLDFPSLDAAVQSRTQLLEHTAGQWNPCWLPAFIEQSGAFVEITGGVTAGPVWSWHSHDAEIYPEYDSILSLVLTTIEIVTSTDGFDTVPWIELRPLVVANNPMSYDATGSHRRTLSKIGTAGWPASWLEAAGVGEMAPGDPQQVTTVADFLATEPFDRALRGTLRVKGGTADLAFAELADGTGSIDLLLVRAQTENFREVLGGMSAEVTLAPIDEANHPLLGPADTDPPTESLGRSFAASYLVVKLIPL